MPRPVPLALMLAGILAALATAEDPQLPRLESPLTPEQERDTFVLPPEFEIELVAAEPELPKPITVTFDDAGRMWSITAIEYPLDANESPGRAKALWEAGGSDRVVVFDDPTAPGRHSPRTFRGGLAMPMGVLPYRDGAIVGQGPRVVFHGDSDGDGVADREETLLHGFGVQDSHLMPHQLTRMPGGWVAVAQGAFNRSRVVAGDEPPVRFDHCKLGRFRLDGSRFEIAGYGLNNIWGLVMTRTGEVFIQEANDLGYSVVPFQVGTSYPGIGNERFRPYAPLAPTVTDYRVGGTGLSGLARSDDREGSFPAPWRDVVFLANPITRTINAARIHDTEDGGYRVTRLDDFMTSSDEWFRPISLTFGPDGCLYIVDWYNEIISHNEVPRDHPARDKSRGRVWRVRHRDMPRRTIPDLTQVAQAELPEHLFAASTWQMRAAWHQIVDRGAVELTGTLVAMAGDRSRAVDGRIHALWALEGLHEADLDLLEQLLEDPDRSMRREAMRVATTLPQEQLLECALERIRDSEPSVRSEAIRSLASVTAPSREILALLVHAGATVYGERHPTAILRSGYDREFERYLVRRALEAHPERVMGLLDSPGARNLPAEGRLLACLALPVEEGVLRFPTHWVEIDRAPSDEELLLLVRGGEDVAAELMQQIFGRPIAAQAMIESLLRLRDRLDGVDVGNAVRVAALAAGDEELLLRAASTFAVASLEAEVVAILDRPRQPATRQLLALRALQAMRSQRLLLFVRFARDTEASDEVRERAALALASCGADGAGTALLELWPSLPTRLRLGLVEHLSAFAGGARVLVAALETGELTLEEIDTPALERMRTVLGDAPEMTALWQKVEARLARVLAFGGGNQDFLDTDLALAGPFTVETWIRLAPGISNADGILGNEEFDINFHDSRLRVWLGPGKGDILIASKVMQPDVWTHVAVTRDGAGRYRIYLGGELDSASQDSDTTAYDGLDLARTNSSRGTQAELCEVRVWRVARSADEIRSAFDRTFADEAPADTLAYCWTGRGEQAVGLHARSVLDAPDLLTAAQAAALEEQRRRYAEVAARQGDAAKGRAIFATCLLCHTVAGEGVNLGPPLDGLAHKSLDGILRALLTPSAAVESGYRAYRVQTTDGNLLEGFLVSKDRAGITLRYMGGGEQRIPWTQIERSGFTNRSMMIPGLLDALSEAQVTDLFEYLRSLE